MGAAGAVFQIIRDTAALTKGIPALLLKFFRRSAGQISILIPHMQASFRG